MIDRTHGREEAAKEERDSMRGLSQEEVEALGQAEEPRQTFKPGRQDHQYGGHIHREEGVRACRRNGLRSSTAPPARPRPQGWPSGSSRRAAAGLIEESFEQPTEELIPR